VQREDEERPEPDGDEQQAGAVLRSVQIGEALTPREGQGRRCQAARAPRDEPGHAGEDQEGKPEAAGEGEPFPPAAGLERGEAGHAQGNQAEQHPAQRIVPGWLVGHADGSKRWHPAHVEQRQQRE
jgi:hypothetical protein